MANNPMDQFIPCGVCGEDPHGEGGCLCPECPVCWEQGNLECWGEHIPLTLPVILSTFPSVPAEWLGDDQAHIPNRANTEALLAGLRENHSDHPLTELAMALLVLHYKTRFARHC